MSTLRREDGIALVTTVVLTAIMLVMGLAMLAIVDTQADQTRKERVGEAAFNLAEATLNAEAFLLGRNWPRVAEQTPDPSAPAAPCSGQTLTGTLADPPTAASPTLQQQIQSMLAQSHPGEGSSGSQWWVTACEEGGRNSWDSTLLGGLAYDPSIVATPAARPRRMWIRAEAKVGAHRRAVVSLVQAGQQPIFPSNLAVATGKLGTSVTTTTGQIVQGGVVGPLLGSLLGSGNDRVIDGPVGLRCSTLDAAPVLDCLAGVFKLTTATTLSPLLHANEFYGFPSDTAITPEQLAQLRQEAQATSSYFPQADSGLGTVGSGDSCLPIGSADKVVFIEQIGDGTGSCTLDTSSGAAAKALIVGSGGVRVTGGGTFTGVVYALHRKALAGDVADIRVEGGSRIVGGAYADDNPSLPSADRRGQVSVVPPPIDMTAVIRALPLCQGAIGTLICNPIVNLLDGPLNIVVSLLSALGVNPTTLVAGMVPQLDSSLPAIVNDPAVVKAVTTLGDSAVVAGTFRQVTPQF